MNGSYKAYSLCKRSRRQLWNRYRLEELVRRHNIGSGVRPHYQDCLMDLVSRHTALTYVDIVGARVASDRNTAR